jgi:hypothetical protein
LSKTGSTPQPSGCFDGRVWLSDPAGPRQPTHPASGTLDTMLPLWFVLVALAGWVNQQQRDVIDYL